MIVHTNNKLIRDTRRAVLELILSNHPMECLTCTRNKSCELQALADQFGVTDIPYRGANPQARIDTQSPSIERNSEKCVLCKRCVSVCQQVQQVAALGVINRGFESYVGPAFDRSLDEVSCIMCGQCIIVCPVAALREKSHIEQVWEALNDPDIHVVAQVAPSIRAALGEEFGLEIGSSVGGKIPTSLRRLGFDKAFDTTFSADLTIMEEGSELLHRVKTGDTLPLITSCSPGWVKYCEHHYPEFLENLSTAKSPQQMFGALAKTYYAQKAGIDPAKIYSVSIMPCTAKKFECQRPEHTDSGFFDVDAILTTRELARMIKEVGIDFLNLPSEAYDSPMGHGTGAGVIFGATGGVMEAALRTAYELATGHALASLDLVAVRGLDGVKEATVTVEGLGDVRVAVAHGISNAKALLEKIKAGEQYHFIEIMACPGGCVGGGGQTLVSSSKRVRLNEDYQKLRAQVLYNEDKDLPTRKSHDNPDVQQVYGEYLGNPLSEKAHHLLHTHYVRRKKYYVEKL
jgi:NADP-reducing hydrogenase subunit HndD